ncbi:YkvA family protein [Taylorella equigenitalis]|uniref:DUF1232 domain-containing protein n=3 Tax=Taylorella equigenitalis TaxID=29575 RepID=A0A654KGP8_TAYEM|nr:YkvA family protein [Taylorella equigenitalis]ADU91601.1 hypothetical protein TEQUI_0663 [Taylorella equigenitalis MCE9]AFN35141.1 hypothetical protein KUI_0036 [Taylorella equigenitalis ATCC 35865]ASY29838.1 hypothetical protein B9Z30_00180 [Taylorella equigenitalis]ASY37141.1 DUF1232 domain-containing protein [Taylorella equigenitalis]ASY38585.1 hypothetical protein CA604_00180 [Taylorella equigenitalis]
MFSRNKSKVNNEASDTEYANSFKKIGSRLGKPLLEKGLTLYYALRSPKTPKWAKRVIYGALAYLFLPIDAIPDLLPGVGFTDDLSVVAGALVTIAAYITPEIKQKARDSMFKWFPKYKD